MIMKEDGMVQEEEAGRQNKHRWLATMASTRDSGQGS